MRLRQIEIFYHVYRAGSISGAARDLNVSQPSVSKVLRHAEDQLGVTLFLRNKGRLVATTAAHELFSEVEDIYHRLSTFSRSLENIAKRRGGNLRLAVLPSLSLTFAPDIIAHLHEEDDAMRFSLTTLHSSELHQSILERDADLTMGFETSDDPRLKSRQIGEGRMVLVCASPIPDAMHSNTSALWEHLQDQPFIGLHDTGPLGKVIDRELAARSIPRDEIVTAHTYHVALALVRKQMGYTITDQFTAYSQLGAGLQRYVLDDWPRIPVFACHLQDHPDTEMMAKTLQLASDVSEKIDAAIASMQPPKA